MTALEPDASALVGAGAIRGLASQASLAIEVVEEFSERLPFPDHSFDLVFARAVLHHTSDLTKACREFHRVLKPGGRLIAIREHVISRRNDLPAFLDLHPLHRLYGGENAFLLSDYVEAMAGSGLVVDAIIAPLRSAINLSPQTPRSLRHELAHRVARGRAWVERTLIAMLEFPGLWRLLLPTLELMDHRPGRLYSFVASRP